MSDVRSRILVGPVTIAPGATRVNAPGSGKVWVIRTVTMVNPGAAAIPYRMGVGGVGDAAAISIGVTVPANSRRVIEERYYIRPENGGLWVQNTSATHTLTICIFGAELDEL